MKRNTNSRHIKSMLAFLCWCSVLLWIGGIVYKNILAHHIQQHEDVIGVRQLDTPPSLVIYNRLPGPRHAGLATLLVFQSLNLVDRRFDQYSSANYTHDRLTQDGEFFLVENLTDIVTTTGSPVLYDRHVRFIDFQRYGKSQPVYINIVDDPVTQIVHLYAMSQSNTTGISQSFEKCVHGDQKSCANNYHLAMMYLCGSSDDCLVGSGRSLEQVKRNIVQHYLVVGVQEQVKEFYMVLSKLLPSYFQGLDLEIQYLETNGDIPLKSSKPPFEVTPATMALLKYKLRLDYELYYFIRQRFHLILKGLQAETLVYRTHEQVLATNFETPAKEKVLKDILKKYGCQDLSCLSCIHLMPYL